MRRSVGLGWILGALSLVTGCADLGGAGDEPANADLAANPTPSAGGAAMLPLVTPPVRAATPPGLQPAPPASKAQRPNLSSSDFKSRFFAAGPTSIFNILGAIDDRISGINRMIETSPPTCLGEAPVAYAIAPFGQSVTMYVQCYDTVGSAQPADPGLLQFGRKDGITYLYQAIGQGEVAAIVTPVVADGGSAGDARVEAWISVGTLNAATSCGGHSNWDGCSYGVIHLWADSATQSFEMTVAGIGFGYCGAQLRSDGTNVYAAGSTDMGTTCNATDTLCVAASDVMTPGLCAASAVSAFTLPGLGRRSDAGTTQTWAASEYPAAAAGIGNVLLNGTSADALYFGPTAPTMGAANLRKP